MQITPERRKGGWASRYGGPVVLLSPTSSYPFSFFFDIPLRTFRGHPPSCFPFIACALTFLATQQSPLTVTISKVSSFLSAKNTVETVAVTYGDEEALKKERSVAR